jgi:hypothetical protein
MHWAEIRGQAHLANAGEFTVSCYVLNLIPVLALGTQLGPCFTPDVDGGFLPASFQKIES